MAVYTTLSDDDIRSFLTRYRIGELVSAHGITEGIENTNYLLLLDEAGARTRYILTVFEKRVDIAQLPFFMGLTSWLADRGVSCPRPVSGWNGGTIYDIKGKRAVIVRFIEGRNNPDITAPHCELVGRWMGRMHLAAEGFSMLRRNSMMLSEWHRLFHATRSQANMIDSGLEQLIQKELAYVERHWPSSLPAGIIHGDVFPDNVFFKQNNASELILSGVIDFYFACYDYWIYDVLIAMNAWCFDSNHQFVPEHARALCKGYQSIRPFTDTEKSAASVLARGAALRFLSTRSYDWVHHNSDALVVPKDPKEYVQKLRFFQQFDGFDSLFGA
ncbi:MAG: homoserine kinase [Rickettsiales bacterium]|nr:homoserine kinase [Rickettsiales bacterium]